MAITIQTERELRKYLFETFLKQQQEKGLLKEAPGGGSPYPTQGSAYNGPSALVQDVINSEVFQDLKNVWTNVAKPMIKDAVSSYETNFEDTVYEAYPVGLKKDRYTEYQKRLQQLKKQVKDKGNYYIQDGYEGESNNIQLNRQKFFDRINVLIERENGLLGDYGPKGDNINDKIVQVKKWNQNNLLKIYFDSKTQKYYFYVPLHVYKKYIGENKNLAFFDNIPTQDYQMPDDNFVFKNVIFDYDIFKNKEVNWHFACLSETINDIKKNPIFNTQIEIPTFDEETSRKIYGNDKNKIDMNWLVKKYGVGPLNSFQNVDKSYFEMVKKDILQGRKLLNYGSRTASAPINKVLMPSGALIDAAADLTQSTINQNSGEPLETAFMIFCDEFQKIYNKYAFAVQTEQFKSIRESLYLAQAENAETPKDVNDTTIAPTISITPQDSYRVDPMVLKKQLESAFGDFDMQLLNQLMQNKRIYDDAGRWVGSYMLDESKKSDQNYDNLVTSPGKYIFQTEYDKLSDAEKACYINTQWSPKTVIKTAAGETKNVEGYEKEERGTDWLLDKFFAWDSGKSFFNYFFRSFTPDEINKMKRGENFEELASDNISVNGVQSYVDAVNIASSFMVAETYGVGLIVGGATAFASWWNRGGYINFLEDKISEIDEAVEQISQVTMNTDAEKTASIIKTDRADGILNDIKKNGINLGNLLELEVSELSNESKRAILTSMRGHLRQTEYLEQLFWFIEIFGWVPILNTHLKCSLLKRLTTRTDNLLASQKSHVIPVSVNKWVDDAGNEIDDAAFEQLEEDLKGKYKQTEVIEYHEVHLDPNSYYEISNFIPGSGYEKHIVAAMDDVMEKLYLNLFIPLREIVEPKNVSKFKVKKPVKIKLTPGEEIDPEIYELIKQNHPLEVIAEKETVYTKPASGLSDNSKSVDMSEVEYNKLDDAQKAKYKPRQRIVCNTSNENEYTVYAFGGDSAANLEKNGINKSLKEKLMKKGINFEDKELFESAESINFNYTFSEFSDVVLTQDDLSQKILQDKVPLYENIANFAAIFKNDKDNFLSVKDIKSLFFKFYNLQKGDLPDSEEFFINIITAFKKANIESYDNISEFLINLVKSSNQKSIDDLITFLKLNDIPIDDDIIKNLKDGIKVEDLEFLKSLNKYFSNINSVDDLDAVYGIRFLKYNFEFINSGKKFPKKADYAYKLTVNSETGVSGEIAFAGKKTKTFSTINRYKSGTSLSIQQFDKLVEQELSFIWDMPAYRKCKTLNEKWKFLNQESDKFIPTLNNQQQELLEKFKGKFKFQEPKIPGGQKQYNKDLEAYLQIFSKSRLNQIDYILNYVIAHQYSQNAAFAALAKKPIENALKYLNNLNDFMHTGTVQVNEVTLSTVFESLHDVLMNMENYCNWLQFAKTSDDGFEVAKLEMYRELSASGAQKFARDENQTIKDVFKTFQEMNLRLEKNVKGNFKIDKIDKISGMNIAGSKGEGLHSKKYTPVYFARIDKLFKDMQNYPKTFSGFKESLENIQRVLKETDDFLKEQLPLLYSGNGAVTPEEFKKLQKMIKDLNDIISSTLTQLNDTSFFNKSGFKMSTNPQSIFKSVYHINEYSRQVFVRLTKTLIQLANGWTSYDLVGILQRIGNATIIPAITPITDFFKDVFSINTKGKNWSDFDWRLQWKKLDEIIPRIIDTLENARFSFSEKRKSSTGGFFFKIAEVAINATAAVIRFGLQHPLLSVTAIKIYNDWKSLRNIDEFEDIKTHWNWQQHVLLPIVYSLLARTATSVILSKNSKMTQQFKSLFDTRISSYLSTYLKQLYLFKRKLILAKNQRIELNSKQRFFENTQELQKPTPVSYKKIPITTSDSESESQSGSESSNQNDISVDAYKVLDDETKKLYQPVYPYTELSKENINNLLEEFQKQNLILNKNDDPEITSFIKKYTVNNPDQSQYEFLIPKPSTVMTQNDKSSQIILKVADKDKNDNLATEYGVSAINYIQIADNPNTRIDLINYKNIGVSIEKEFNSNYNSSLVNFEELFTKTPVKDENGNQMFYNDATDQIYTKKTMKRAKLTNLPIAVNLEPLDIEDIKKAINRTNTQSKAYIWNNNIDIATYQDQILNFKDKLGYLISQNQIQYHTMSSNIFKCDNYVADKNKKEVIKNKISLSEQYTSVVKKLYKNFYIPSLNFGQKNPAKFKLHFYWHTIISKKSYSDIPDIRYKLTFLDFWARNISKVKNLDTDYINVTIGYLKNRLLSLKNLKDETFFNLTPDIITDILNSEYFKIFKNEDVNKAIDTAKTLTDTNVKSVILNLINFFKEFITDLQIRTTTENQLNYFIMYLEGIFLIKRCQKIQDTFDSIREVMDVKELPMQRKLVDDIDKNDYKIMDHHFDIKSMLTNGLNSVLYKTVGSDISKTGIRINPIFYNADQITSNKDQTYLDLIGGNNDNPLDTLFINNIKAITIDKNDDVLVNITNSIITIDSIIDSYIKIYNQIFKIVIATSNNELPMNVVLDKNVVLSNEDQKTIQNFQNTTNADDEDLSAEEIIEAISYRDLNKLLLVNNRFNKKRIIREAPDMRKISTTNPNLFNRENQLSALKIKMGSNDFKDFNKKAFQNYLEKKRNGFDSLKNMQQEQESIISNLRNINTLILSTDNDINYDLSDLVNNTESLHQFFNNIESTLNLIDNIPMIDIEIESSIVLLKRMLGLKNKVIKKINEIKDSIDENGTFFKILKEINPIKTVSKKEEKKKVKNVFDNYLDHSSKGYFKKINAFINSNDKNSTSESVIKLKFARMLYISTKFLMPIIKEINNNTESNKSIKLINLMKVYENNLKNMYSDVVDSQKIELTEYLSFLKKIHDQNLKDTKINDYSYIIGYEFDDISNTILKIYVLSDISNFKTEKIVDTNFTNNFMLDIPYIYEINLKNKDSLKLTKNDLIKDSVIIKLADENKYVSIPKNSMQFEVYKFNKNNTELIQLLIKSKLLLNNYTNADFIFKNNTDTTQTLQDNTNDDISDKSLK